jgi:YVTN family beta-propeller protein
MSRFVLRCAIFFIAMIAGAHAAPFGYIADAGFSKIIVMDLATGKQRASIPFPTNEAYFIAVTPDGKRAYVANNGIDGAMWVVDTLTMQLTGHIALDSGPQRSVFSPDGKYLYTVYPFDSKITSILTATNTPTTIPVGSSPCDVVFTPDSTRAYVVNRDGTVSVVDTSANVVTKTISIGTTNFYECGGIAITPDGSRIYVTRYDSDKASIIDTATNTVVGSPIAVGSDRSARIIVAPDDSRVYFLSAEGASLSVVSRATNALLLTVPLGVYPLDMITTPDGSELFISDDDDYAVWAVKTADYSTRRIGGFCSPHSIAFGPIATSDQLFGDQFGC